MEDTRRDTTGHRLRGGSRIRGIQCLDRITRVILGDSLSEVAQCHVQ